MNNTWVIRIVSVLVVALVGLWLVSATEWADTEVPTPASGEAKKNRFYGAQAMLRELGMKVVKRESLDTMPPAQARLVLASSYWDMFPERGKRLREWVEQGGHLVIPAYLVSGEQLEDWLPLVREKQPASDEKKKTPPEPKKKAPASRRFDPPPKDADCHAVTEPDTVPASFAGGRSFRVCAWWSSSRYKPADKQPPPLWTAVGARGTTEAIRVRVGRGTVTVMPWGLWHNENLVRADNALFAAAAVQARSGAEVWFVVEETREPFMLWLWQRGWVAMVVGMLALAFALWRAAVRFGPLAPSAGTHRRSMAEQVRGTAGFLHMHGADALHAAQLRALNESARRQLRGYAHRDAAARAAAIAQATGLEAAMLVRAMDGARPRHAGAMAVDLEVLETARRRLDANGPFMPRSSASSSSSAQSTS
ncbi:MULTISPECIES: DUF4350 domain-containing protein [unclassified Variovorax]|jgi:hypothetical protein|uniref:DUF4350 domain-containing protein n=1 Tax=unclassified Variovorax TaxID=663243 RepID=UPI000F7F4B78|nr:MULTISPECIES: DUF4350 domain-containing protein [unclassified Variovorax]RSZ32672.1 DUF4350 domain-containing protein [Variovorax sp. 553]RSZ33092.1 DUF4350 domain-containing protein [Variovorax sp. 679]